MRVLVTGANGFVGRHLVAELLSGDHHPVLLDRQSAGFRDDLDYVQGDILDPRGLEACLETWSPDGCIHLAGMAFVPAADEAPSMAFQVNTVGTLNLLESFRRLHPSARILAVSTAHAYAPPVSPGHPIPEDHPLTPSTLYGASKAAADHATLLVARRHGFAVMTARPSNHLGPGQDPQYVAPAFAGQVAAIRRGDKEPVLRVGNLDSRREFLDVRDVVAAYRMLLENGTPGEPYNVGTGTLVPVRRVLKILCDLAGVQPKLDVDPGLYRPTDDGLTLDCDKIRRSVGWTPARSLEKTLADVLDAVEPAGEGL